MKRLFILLAAAVFLLLAGCGAVKSEESAQTLRVSIVESGGFTVQNNGRDVLTGEDAVFSIVLSKGKAIGGVDYPGEYTLTQNDRNVLLTLHGVTFPTVVHLDVYDDSWELRYEPNGAAGSAVLESVPKTGHVRPNTSTGEGMFYRKGYTPVGWNTEPDGSGTAIGLGSRVSAGDGVCTLYAQWVKWTDEDCFTRYEEDGGAVITLCSCPDEVIAVPETLGGLPVTRICENAFNGLPVRTLYLPATMRQVEDGAFADSALEELYLFDSIEEISNAAAEGCKDFRTIHINAVEAPAGYASCRESCYADKVDLLIEAAGEKKLVFYGGCSVWYNLDANLVQRAYGRSYRIIDLGLNGTVSSEIQLQILSAFLEEGDVLFHTPELSSDFQMMRTTELTGDEGRLWAGLENNYDLLALVDARSCGDILGSLCDYLSHKSGETTYNEVFRDVHKHTYFGKFGEVPFTRTESMDELADEISLSADLIDAEGMARLSAWYDRFDGMGVKVFVSYACVNLDALTSAERQNVAAVDAAFHRAMEETGGTLISKLSDYCYYRGDFYDTNYHLLSRKAEENTRKWLRDLAVYLPADNS